MSDLTLQVWEIAVGTDLRLVAAEPEFDERRTSPVLLPLRKWYVEEHTTEFGWCRNVARYSQYVFFESDYEGKRSYVLYTQDFRKRLGRVIRRWGYLPAMPEIKEALRLDVESIKGGLLARRLLPTASTATPEPKDVLVCPMDRTE